MSECTAWHAIVLESNDNVASERAILPRSVPDDIPSHCVGRPPRPRQFLLFTPINHILRLNAYITPNDSDREPRLISKTPKDKIVRKVIVFNFLLRGSRCKVHVKCGQSEIKCERRGESPLIPSRSKIARKRFVVGWYGRVVSIVCEL